MKKFTLTLIKSVFLLLILVGCGDEFLEHEPTDSISDDKVFDSYITANSALIGVYDQLSSFNFEGLYNPIMSDIMGEDIMINSVDNWNWWVPVYQMNVLPNYTYVDNPWWSGYKLIHDANKIIDNASYIPDATTDQIDELTGQARVLRAYTMLKLAQMYSVAYVKDPSAPSILLNTDSENTDSGFTRATLTEVYDQIENDLLTAISQLENNTDKGFFDKRAAQAVLARAYLDMQNWESASEMANSAAEGMTLMDINEMYSGFFARNSETIFTIAYTQEDNNVYLSIPSFYWPVAGYSSIRANDDFVSKFSNADARKGLFLKQNDIDPDRYLVLKFGHNSAVGNAERICIRASEMILIEAEAEAELGNYSNAQNLLYNIQKRSNPGVIKSTATGQTLIDEILLERRKELFGEGFRWNDIKRRQLPFNRSGDHWVKMTITAQDADYYRLTFPIPQSEIDANELLSNSDQNVGY
ncbi:RagB/SusD family nutrient uptake outer membrane protein [Marinigracilibium pacificum]|uniref:RagB/SusD family nutrient uptake outer membrane protein n=1 Tax=Marinigracilibium pacificum TaxID=2729599 RepID=A0A848IVG3_9BACT|nr:RagB/SusD family nutrient uptake outer membrane protein [Marinigracilibium pacificum]NMM48327.1 RagB/SusD family nutrient uptake outer membrane protein [Marinigracilibium pacificum]